MTDRQHKRSESDTKMVTPNHKTAARPPKLKIRPMSMFVKSDTDLLPPEPHTPTSDGPEIPRQSPERARKRFSLIDWGRKPSFQLPPKSPARMQVQHDSNSPASSLARSGSLQTKQYNFGHTDIPKASPLRNKGNRQSGINQVPALTPVKPLSVGSQEKIKTASVEKLPKTPEVQTSVWIEDEKPKQNKRSSFLGRSQSLRRPAQDLFGLGLSSPGSTFSGKGHRKSASNGGPSIRVPPRSPVRGLSSSLISSPKLVGTTNKAQSQNIPHPVMSPPPKFEEFDTSTDTCAPKPRPDASKRHSLLPAPAFADNQGSEGKRSLLKRLFTKKRPSPRISAQSTVVSTPASSTPVSTPASVKLKRYSAAPVSAPVSAPAPSRPQRSPHLDLTRNLSDLSLQSSNGSKDTDGSHSSDLVTPTTRHAFPSPKVYDQEWGYSVLSSRSTWEDKRRSFAPPASETGPAWI